MNPTIYAYLVITLIILCLCIGACCVGISLLHPTFLLINEFLRNIPLPSCCCYLSPWFSQGIATYFHHSYHFEKPRQDYLMPSIKCFSPHGLLPYGVGAMAFHPETTDIFDPAKNTLTVAHQLFQLPLVSQFVRDVIKAIPNDYDSMDSVLSAGKSLIILPGGIRETIASDHRKEILYIRRRKGVFELALRHGVPLVPIYTFGLSEVYIRGRSSLRIPDLFGSEEESVSWMWGVYGTLFPHRKRLFTVVGTPLPVVKVENPSSDDISTLKERYIVEVKDLFLRWREKYDVAWKNKELEII